MPGRLAHPSIWLNLASRCVVIEYDLLNWGEKLLAVVLSFSSSDSHR